MAGSLYLGSQKVCPALLLGSTPEPTEYFTFKFPDGLKVLSGSCQFAEAAILPRDSNNDDLPLCFDFNEVEEISGFSSLYHIGNDCERVVLKNLSSIKKLSGIQCFSNCFLSCTFETGYTDIVFGGLEELTGYYCLANSFRSNSITSIHFPKLVNFGSNNLSYFGDRNGMAIYFEAAKTTSFTTGNELSSICMARSGKILHFPSNLSSVISSQSGYPNFGGTDTIILYDLPATE